MRHAWLSVALAVVIPVVANAQVTQAPSDIEARLRALEEQVQVLQAEIAALKGVRAAEQPPPAPAVAQPLAMPATPAQLAAAPTGGDQPAPGQLPVYGGMTAGKLLNPDVGLIGNFITASGESRGGSESVAPFPFMTLQESEASFQAIVDPFARADFFLAIGEEGIEVEEGYISFPTIPGGVLVKAGKFRANFGRLNAFHNHTLPWIDRPLVMFNLLGGATEDPDTGIKDAGVSVSRIIPAGNLFLEATGELFRGDSGTLWQADRRRDVAFVGRVRSYGDITEDTNLEAGFSYGRGRNDQGSDFLTQLYGVDLTLRWKPLRRAKYRSFVARNELMWSRREESTGRQNAFGTFLSADYQLSRRWFAGARYDWAERARVAGVHDWGASTVLTFWPSEFSQVRGQYRRTRYAEGSVANELLFQVLFTIGAHGAHPF